MDLNVCMDEPRERRKGRRIIAPSFALLAAILTGGCSSTETSEKETLFEQSVKPGINDPFLDPELKISEWTEGWETESREIAANRDAIAAAVGIRPGMAVADVGAGTGLFLEPFATAVGPRGRVFAIDIIPKFVDHLRARAKRAGWSQVVAVLCTDRSIGLPPGSIDLAFLCDVYHHLEYPKSSMTSIHRALRPGGQVVVVDFKRIEGESREWILDHVRAGQEVVAAEIESVGFIREADVEVPGLVENYFMRFTKRP